MMRRLLRPRSCGIGMTVAGTLMILLTILQRPTPILIASFCAGGVLVLVGTQLLLSTK